ncbi:MAG: hypothetical protein Kow0042_14180 [Calditrichia bacterium]
MLPSQNQTKTLTRVKEHISRFVSEFQFSQKTFLQLRMLRMRVKKLQTEVNIYGFMEAECKINSFTISGIIFVRKAMG